MRKITSRFPGLKVLLVEDYVINQEVTKDMLELMQCEVDVAEEGSAALQLAKETNYDLILMDLQLPGMDGIEVTRALRKAGNKSIIVALTANSLDGNKDKCIDAGMNDYMSKPIEAANLETLLKKFFTNKLTVVS